MLVSRSLLTATAFALLCATATAASNPVIVNPQTAKWQAGPLKGTQISTIVGNPSTPGAYYAYFLKVPAGTKVPVHFHRLTENVTVISGTMMVGVGDVMNVAKMATLPAGNVVSIPAGIHHYAMAKEDSVIEISGIGPDTTTFVHK